MTDRSQWRVVDQSKPTSNADVSPTLSKHDALLPMMQRDGYTPKYVPERFRDREICLAVVRQDGPALPYVPSALKDREMCLVTVRDGGALLEPVPEALRDGEIQEATRRYSEQRKRFSPTLR